MKKLDNYYIGLDIGTSSVGWAVTDEQYSIPKFNGKKMWGVRLFDEAKTAEERRTQRGSRRRLNRRKERINLLKNFFAEEIFKVDENFFIRLKNSDLYQEDKDEKLKSKYTLFNDDKFKDKDYHKKYPTIHHLIMDLIEDDNKKDIRLLYLACHYLLKNRGHFIFEGQNFNVKSSFNNAIGDLENHLRDEYDVDIDIDKDKLRSVLTDNTLNKTAKKRELKGIVGDTKFLKAVSAVMIGSSQSLADLFDDEELKEASKKSVDFSKADFDENYGEYEAVLGEKIALLNVLKEIYDASVLENLMKDASESSDGFKYISSSFVNKYQKHANDLKKLKRLVKDNLKSEYFDIFRNEKSTTNYVAYTKSNITKSKRTKADKFVKTDDFYKFIKAKLEKIKSNCNESLESDKKVVDQISQILLEIEQKTFLPKLKSSDNGVIPYQLKEKEFQKILDNQSKYYEFLNIKDEYGTVKDKILSIMTFRIPYYVGPLNEDSKFAWIKRGDKKITPWNFSDVVDLGSSREEFIDRLVGRCTYLKDEVVLPKSSLIYNEFMVLNELNNLKLNDELITDDLKKKIFNDLFKTQRKVTLKKVQNLIKKELNELSQVVLTGTDGDFKQNLNSYHDFKNIIGEKIENEDYINAVEEIIKFIVLYVDDKKYLSKKIKLAYGNMLSEDEIKKICNLKYKDWGRLSKKLLVGIEGADKTTGETGTIMHFMREYNFNLMELMSDRFTFTEEIKKLNPEDHRELCYEMVDELYLSPSVKRMLWQSLRIVDEIRNIMGKDPQKIFIEMARGKEEIRARKKSRKDQLMEYYRIGKKVFVEEVGLDEYNRLYEDMKKEDENKFRWDNLYLYYTQLGRCMYSLEPIDIDHLSDKNIYDQDHIYPKSKIYDDSLENRVLVKKNLNSTKGNQYPIPSELLNKNCNAFWKMLFDKGLIGNKKYSRLTRRTPFTDDDLIGFIERQIVETRQATKETANLLKKVCKNSEIVYSKAENAARFRQEFDIIKCRSVNDLHHMHDAYLNIVVGSVYNTKFTKSPANFVKSGDKSRSYNLENMFKYDVKRGNYTAWISYDNKKKNKDATIIRVKNELNGTNYRFTRMNYIESGVLFNATLQRKGKGKRPLKDIGPKTDISKYGGYTNINKSYFILVDINGKKIKERKLIPVDREVFLKINQNNNQRQDIIRNYFLTRFGIEEYNIVYPEIKMKSMLKINGSYYFITGGTEKTLELRSAIQLILPKKSEEIIRRIEKDNDNNFSVIIKNNVVQEFEIDRTFELIIKKFENSIYKNSFLNDFEGDNEKVVKNAFYSLSIADKCSCLLMLVKAIRASGIRQDLKIIKMKSDYGRLSSKSNKLNSYYEFKLINQSITGLFENEVDLLKL